MVRVCSLLPLPRVAAWRSRASSAPSWCSSLQALRLWGRRCWPCNHMSGLARFLLCFCAAQNVLVFGDVRKLAATADELLREKKDKGHKSRAFWEIFSRRVKASAHLLPSRVAAKVARSFDSHDQDTGASLFLFFFFPFPSFFLCLSLLFVFFFFFLLFVSILSASVFFFFFFSPPLVSSETSRGFSSSCLASRLSLLSVLPSMVQRPYKFCMKGFVKKSHGLAYEGERHLWGGHRDGPEEMCGLGARERTSREGGFLHMHLWHAHLLQEGRKRNSLCVSAAPRTFLRPSCLVRVVHTH